MVGLKINEREQNVKEKDSIIFYFSHYNIIKKLNNEQLGRLFRALFEKQLGNEVVLENDIAKVLGNAINVLLERKKDFICIDGIYANDGDYIDIGEPVAMGRVVPVVTKTLIFNS